MDKNSLYRFFEGQASIEEMKAVKEWAESSEEHSKQFHRERKLFNAMILIGNPKWTAINTTKRNRYFIREFLKIASVIIIAVSITATIFSITNEHHKHVDIAMQTIIVPAGQRVNIELPDGSNVWLNAGTQMQYPVSFMEDKREIILDGEAYFDVRKDPEKQFIVSTAHQSAIKVLGTKFNVKAYKEADEVITTLVEGKVNFEFNNASQQPQYIVMAPGQKLVYYFQDGKTELYTTSGERELSWKDGKIIFRQTSLRDALDILADRYNAEFVVRENVPHDDSFSGTFTNRNLEQILNFISVSSKVRWRYLNNNGTAGKEKIKIEIFI